MLKGKVAIITGGTRGIGLEIVRLFKENGAEVILLGSRAETVDKAIQLLNDEDIKIEGYYPNLSNYDEVKQVADKIAEKYGKIDILVNNAGITKDNLILRMNESDFDSVINVNLKGSFNCLKAVTPIMLKQKHGKIINMASVVGVIGNPGQVNYCASKAGVIGMTKSLAKELGGKNINVNAIAPGFIDTDMTKVLSEKKNILSQVPLKRLGLVSDVANVAAFLASEDSDYITGQVIHVDGGMAM